MAITLVGSLKGGSGKSTIATNLAAWRAGRRDDVLLVDANAEQRTAAMWAERREQHDNLAPISCIEKTGNIYKSLQQLRDRYTHIIVDSGGGKDSPEFRTSLLAADTVIIPVRPAQFDNETLIYVADQITEAREMGNENLEAYLLFTQVHSNPRVKHHAESRELVSGIKEFVVLNSFTTSSTRFVDSQPAGASVIEMGKSKSANEIYAIANEVYGL